MSAASGLNLNETENLRILKELAEALNEANDVSSAMEVILPRLGQVLGLATAWAFRYDASRSSFVEVGASGLPPALAENNASPLKSGWCECQSQFVDGRMNTAINLVRCSRLRDAVGDKAGLIFHASIPLRSKGKPLGILNVAATGPTAFTEEALALLTAIGHQVATAVDRAGLLAAERQRSLQLQALSDITAELVRFVDTDRVLQFAVDRFVEALDFEACGILDDSAQTDDDGNASLVAAAHRDVSKDKEEYSYSEDNPPPLLPSHQQVVLSDARSCLEQPIPQSPYRLRVESRTANAFTQGDENLLSAFAWHITAALENVNLYRQSMKSAKWQERRRLAADLHDAVSQRLFSALLLARSASLSQANAGQTAESNQTLHRIQLLISESQQEMRELIRALRPVQEEDLVTAIRNRIAPLQVKAGIQIDMSYDEQLPELCDSVQQALLNVVNEALHNLVRHSNCTRASIHVGTQGRDLILEVQDNGIGFDVNNVTRGLGTTTMKERVEQFNGHLTVTSQPGRGCRVSVSVPLSKCTRVEGESR